MNLQEKLKQNMMEKIDKQKTEGSEFLTVNKQNAGVIELPGGMQYLVLKEGSGRKPSIGSKIKAHYAGSLLNGNEFDSSYKRGQPFDAPITGLIKGWQIALPMMPVGSKWRLWIPSELGYGDRGAGAGIPGGATLIFDIELLEILS